MIGKKIPVMDFDLKFGSDPKQVEVFVTFKYKKDGNNYAIYKYLDNNTLMYGSSFFKDDSLVIIDIKDNKEELIKEFINYFLNDDINDYEILSLDKIVKTEIIGENTLKIETNIINKLEDKTIEKEKIITENIQPNKKSKAPLIIIFLILIIIGFIIYYNYKEKDSNIIYLCQKELETNEVDAKLTEELKIEFNNKENVENIKNNIYYKFNSATSYFEFKNNNKQYNYLNENSTYKYNDETITLIEYKQIEQQDFPSDINEVIGYYKLDGYTCNEVDDE